MSIRYLLAVAGILAIGTLITGNARSETIDGVVATVDREAILRSDLFEQIGPLLQTLRDQGLSGEAFNREANAALRDALDQAIEQKILYREALLIGFERQIKQIEIAVEEQLDKFRKQFNSNEEFLKVLEEAGESMSDFRESLKKQFIAISMAQAKRYEFEQEAVITEDDMRAYYEAHRDEFSHEERIHLRRIFLDAGSDTESRVRARARIEELREEAALGAEFAELAKTYSQGPEAEEGGLLGWIARGDLVEALDGAAFALGDGEVSPPVETEFGYHILRVDDRQAAGTATFDDIRTEIEPRLRASYAQERYKKWISELRKRSRVTVHL